MTASRRFAQWLDAADPEEDDGDDELDQRPIEQERRVVDFVRRQELGLPLFGEGR